ncbi:helix-turn-helix domain-containing protein [Purpureocillium lavendulum]|uniref:Helix-turn-helix domain-containing protein n=1 Tax=Purpureocillium lavendulum TaxID=1247861 RepID=A0AB34FQU7_9HYPO|nr:helix-turn-helix domain-containing protein [Purpureocillium lavendulum]
MRGVAHLRVETTGLYIVGGDAPPDDIQSKIPKALSPITQYHDILIPPVPRHLTPININNVATMSYAIYDASIVLAKDALASLSAVLKKGEEHADAASLPEARIFSDMLPLAFQVHMVTDISSKVYARLSGVEPKALENNMKTFADFNARIAEVQDILAKADEKAINARVAETVTIGLGPGKSGSMSGAGYVNGYVIPNIFFHLTTAYDILRKEGVPLGKMDYLTPFIGKHIQQ